MKAVRVIREPGRNTIDTTDYPAYLESIRDRMPRGALEYAAAPWHYDFSHEACPHDSNLASLIVTGSSLPESANRQLGTTALKLFGSHRNGMLGFSYPGLRQVVLSAAPDAPDQFGDVLVDEISLAEDGLIVHEIVFDKATLTIHAADVLFSWQPGA